MRIIYGAVAVNSFIMLLILMLAIHVRFVKKENNFSLFYRMFKTQLFI